MDEERLVRTSKFLSRHLRHDPQRLGLELAPGGWVNVDDLLAGCATQGMHLTRAELEEVVERNSKQRFAYDETGTCIRANQGHSVEVDLQLEPVAPPATLYHGTGHRTVEGILKDGLKKMSRHHVHLSGDVETARTVGARHGKPVVLQVNAAAMAQDGHLFYLSENGVWLTEQVPPAYLKSE